MNRWKSPVFNTTLCFNSLLFLFAIAGDRLKVPAWLQVGGRMHPLLVHFPIVLLVIYIAWTLFKPKTTESWLLLITAFTTALTATTGLLLSREAGYNPEAIGLHKYGGILLSLATLAWYYWLPAIQTKIWAPKTAALAAGILVLITGHEGSVITHGDNYLLAPITPDKKRSSVPLEQAQVFRDMVMPVLETKCLSCHSYRKAKGELILETQNTILKGGKHGPLFIKGQPDLSLLLQRIHLPMAEKKHMPPLGKQQPDDDEIAILYQWIKGGADFNQKVTDLSASDTLHMLAENIFSQPVRQEEDFDFSAADDKEIEKLNNNNRQVHPIASGSPALSAGFYNRGLYTTASLKELEKVKKQLVWLDMSYMPLKDEDMQMIAGFNNLRHLNLNFSTVPGKSLASLKKLAHLEQLSVSGTALTADDLKPLADCKKLQTVYCWELGIRQQDLAEIKKRNPSLIFQTGVNNDTLKLKLNAPILLTEARVIDGSKGPLALKLKHFIRGVEIRYTLDGSLPDSLNAPIFKDSIMLDKASTLKVRAFKKGWLGSDSLITAFYKNTFHPDSIRSITPLDTFYPGSLRAKTLIDGDKGDFNFGSGRWLGFRRNRMEIVLRYPNPINVSSVSVSSQTNSGAQIMPPVSIECWGGASEHSLTRLGRLTPSQPDSIRPATMQTYDFNFNPTKIRYLKIVATPVSKLPPWHPAKGQPGWFFTDEIFVN